MAISHYLYSNTHSHNLNMSYTENYLQIKSQSFQYIKVRILKDDVQKY